MKHLWLPPYHPLLQQVNGLSGGLEYPSSHLSRFAMDFGRVKYPDNTHPLDAGVVAHLHTHECSVAIKDTVPCACLQGHPPHPKRGPYGRHVSKYGRSLCDYVFIGLRPSLPPFRPTPVTCIPESKRCPHSGRTGILKTSHTFGIPVESAPECNRASFACSSQCERHRDPPSEAPPGGAKKNQS